MDKHRLLLSWKDDFFQTAKRWTGRFLLGTIANITLLTVVVIFAFILWKSGLFFFETENPFARIWEMLTSSHWTPEAKTPEYGMLTMIYGSAFVTVVAMVFAIPLSISTAVVLSDMVPFQVRQWIKPIMELLAAIPSVAFGFFAIKVVAPWLQSTFGLPTGTNVLNAAMILAIMAIPTIVSVAEDSLTNLGRELREASYALGATRFETIFRVILPAAKGGISTAIVLGVMRAIGETMVVWMAAGNASQFGGLTDAVRTMTATIAGDMGETSAESVHRSALFAVGFVLLLFTFAMNLLVEYLQSEKTPRKTKDNKNIETVSCTDESDFPQLVIKQRHENRLHLYSRLVFNHVFTGICFLSVGVLGMVLLVVLGPLMTKGSEAVIFRGTVEHRLFLLNHYGRGNAEVVQKEYQACLNARKPVYDMLNRYAWLCPEPLVEMVSKWDRETRDACKDTNKEIERASRKLRRTFENMIEAEDVDAVQDEYEKLLKVAAETELDGTAASNIPIAAKLYNESTRNVDLTLRNQATIVDPSVTYAEAFREIRNRILGTDGNGALLGPENREGITHLPPELQYGTTHWNMSKKYNELLQNAVVWQPQTALDGTVLANVKTEVNRRDIFAAPEFQEIRAMLDAIDRDLESMLNPRWTFYPGWFYDTATAGHFLGGVGPELFGTLLITVCTIVLGLPVGVATAAYLSEATRENLFTKSIRLSINTLAGVPSIVFGLFGLAIIVPYFTGTPCILAGSITLALLVLPVVIRASEEAIRAVPVTFKEAALGLGASPGRCFWTVTLPSALPGILTGTILAMSRAAGETAPLLFTCAIATGTLALSQNPLMQPTPILSYSAYDIAVGDRLAELVPYNQFGLVATLIMMVLALNLAAILIRARIAHKLRGG